MTETDTFSDLNHKIALITVELEKVQIRLRYANTVDRIIALSNEGRWYNSQLHDLISRRAKFCDSHSS